jgi:hypothetical protein
MMSMFVDMSEVSEYVGDVLCLAVLSSSNDSESRMKCRWWVDVHVLGHFSIHVALRLMYHISNSQPFNVD